MSGYFHRLSELASVTYAGESAGAASRDPLVAATPAVSTSAPLFEDGGGSAMGAVTLAEQVHRTSSSMDDTQFDAVDRELADPRAPQARRTTERAEIEARDGDRDAVPSTPRHLSAPRSVPREVPRST